MEPIEIPYEILSVTITPNCYNTWSEFCSDHTDSFCSLISNSKVRNVLFYNNKDCGVDAKRYGQVYEKTTKRKKTDKRTAKG